MTVLIEVEDLEKIYQVPEREGGFWAAMQSLLQRRFREVKAVDRIQFQVEAGEIVGFLGPNGAGKTTTLKMLSGLLYPTSGQAQVLGFTPWKREKGLLQQISLVMGQRQQLMWDIPVIDSCELARVIYRLPAPQYRQTLNELTDLLEIGELLRKPPRNLSLGERMKCEVAAALLHRPKVLFLDEPTIGLDVTMQRRIRAFIRDYNQKHGATVLLTSHYMADVEALCKRVLVIHHGRLLFDGELSQLVERFSSHKKIVLELPQIPENLGRFGEVMAQEGLQVTLKVPKASIAQVTGQILSELPVIDLTIEDPPIEDVIESVFAQEKP